MPSPKKPVILLIGICFSLSAFSQKYQNFKVAVYTRAFEVKKMGDTTGYLKPIWNEMTRQLKIDKIYLETHRDLVIVDQKTLDIVKKFFKDRGVETAGGITFTISEPNRFQTFCYSDPTDRKRAKDIVEFTAKNFDEMILDDFFFTNCKDDGAIKEKGNRSWTQYRLELMTEAAKSLVVGPAKAVNPKVKVIVKYPNWYEHFQGLGFNLETEPSIFDGIYTGTETRDATLSAQHLQPYLGYNIFRYFENIKPHGNGGGWVDPFGMGNLDRYAEQLWITLFAKAPQVILFDFSTIQRKIIPADRAPWQGQKTSFDYEEMMKPISLNGGSPEVPTTIARAAGYAFESVDKFLGKLGNPVGIRSYKPFHSVGEDFLQNYLGMIGLPMNEEPRFPAEDSVILLTEEAAYDKDIVTKIKGQLVQGKSVIITSGLLSQLQGKGIEDIAELRYTNRKALVEDFIVGFGKPAKSESPILIPQIAYLTNDSWEMLSAINGPNGWPILHEADYSKGKFYVLTIPENFADLYKMPAGALNVIRKVLCSQMKVFIEGPANISIYVYDNNTCVVESFLPQETELNIVTVKDFNKLTDLTSGETLTGTSRNPQRMWFAPKDYGTNTFTIKLKPHSFRVFKFE